LSPDITVFYTLFTKPNNYILIISSVYTTYILLHTANSYCIASLQLGSISNTQLMRSRVGIIYITYNSKGENEYQYSVKSANITLSNVQITSGMQHVIQAEQLSQSALNNQQLHGIKSDRD